MLARRAISPLGLAAALAGCSAPEPDHDVAFYRDHASQRAVKLAACRADPGRLQRTANCVNALAADGQVTSQRFWNVSKLGTRVAGAAGL
ncbi:MAG TPA: EexN family lipoprotein [Caulobacteraceae bacterium]|nr:EexN family lipoprotein [Caulobacteraceae bacterium]